MKSICVFAATNSTKSINKQLAIYAASLMQGVQTDVLDLNDFEMPIFSPEREEQGIPELAGQFNARLAATDGLIISLAEHNGSFSAAFKNVFDWASRLEGDKGWKDKPVLLLSTSPGGRGGVGVLNHAIDLFPHFGMQICGSFSLPKFYETFVDDTILDEVLNADLQAQIQKFSKAI